MHQWRPGMEQRNLFPQFGHRLPLVAQYYSFYYLFYPDCHCYLYHAIRHQESNRLNRQILLEHIEKQNQQRIHESKLNFFTNVAHEFFTPLTLIYGPAQHLLEKADLDSYTKRYIYIIKNNADRCRSLSTN